MDSRLAKTIMATSTTWYTSGYTLDNYIDDIKSGKPSTQLIDETAIRIVVFELLNTILRKNGCYSFNSVTNRANFGHMELPEFNHNGPVCQYCTVLYIDFNTNIMSFRRCARTLDKVEILEMLEQMQEVYPDEITDFFAKMLQRS